MTCKNSAWFSRKCEEITDIFLYAAFSNFTKLLEHICIPFNSKIGHVFLHLYWQQNAIFKLHVQYLSLKFKYFLRKHLEKKNVAAHFFIWTWILSSGPKIYHLNLNSIIWTYNLSSEPECYLLDLNAIIWTCILSSEPECYHLNLNIIIWTWMLSPGPE